MSAASGRVLELLSGQPSMGSTNSDRRCLVDKKIQSLKEDILELHRYRNSLVPINRLPYELLSRSLWFLSRECGVSLGMATRVCRRWREVALDNLGLWNYVMINTRYWSSVVRAVVFFKRSRDAELHINLTGRSSQRPMPKILKQLKPYMHRTAVFKCQISDAMEMCDVVYGCMKFTAPKLRQLTLRVTQSRVTGAIEMADPVTMSSLFGGDVPSLRSLDIASVCISFPNCSNLTHLSLVTYDPPRALLLQELLSVLRSSPGLQKLILVDSIIFPDIHQQLELIPLPNLSLLHIEDVSISVIGGILTHTQISTTARIYLAPDRIEEEHLTYLSLRNVAGLAQARAIEWHREDGKDGKTTVRVHCGELSFEDPAFTLSIAKDRENPSVPASILKNLHFHFDLSNVDTLIVSNVDDPAWIVALCRIARLENLRLINMSPACLQHTLSMMSGMMMCPKLRSLDIVNVAFDTAMRRELLGFVGERKATTPLREIELLGVKGWRQDSEDAQQLRTLCETVYINDS